MASKSGKGNQFTRDVCYMLSPWWEAGREDIFWLPGGSGARATSRAKKGKQTKGQHGDIIATDPIGQPLMDAITFECKRGYTTRHPYEVLDKSPITAVGDWEGFLVQAVCAHRAAGSLSWAVLHRRNLREAWVFQPLAFIQALRPHGGFTKRPADYIQFATTIRSKVGQATEIIPVEVFGCPWAAWLQAVTPRSIRRLVMEAT